MISGSALQGQDLSALRSNTIYQGVFHDQHPIIHWFWKIVQQFTLVQRKQFLSFVTGSERIPIGGLITLKLIIQSTEQEASALPSAHTCFNLLFLSCHYLNANILQEKLFIALNHFQGFGLA